MGTQSPFPVDIPRANPQEIAAISKDIFDAWHHLRDRLSAHHEIFKKRWTKFHPDKRRKILQEIESGMPARHRPDLLSLYLWRDTDMKKAFRPSKRHLLWPNVTLDDLTAQERPMLRFIQSRSIMEPMHHYYHDSFAVALAWCLHPFKGGKPFIKLPPDSDLVMRSYLTDEWANYVKMVDPRLPDPAVQAGKAMGLPIGLGCMVLTIHRGVYRFLSQVCDSVLHDLPGKAKYNAGFELVANNVPLDLIQLRQERPYHAPNRLHLHSLFGHIKNYRKVARDFVLDIIEKPRSFLEYVREVKAHSPQLVHDESGKTELSEDSDELWFIASKAAVHRALDRLVRWTVLEKCVEALIYSHDRGWAKSDDPTEQISLDEYLALHDRVRLSCPLVVLVNRLLGDMTSSPGFRPYFERKYVPLDLDDEKGGEPEKTGPEKKEPEKTGPEKKEPEIKEPEKKEPEKKEPEKREPEKEEPEEKKLVRAIGRRPGPQPRNINQMCTLFDHICDNGLIPMAGLPSLLEDTGWSLEHDSRLQNIDEHLSAFLYNEIDELILMSDVLLDLNNIDAWARLGKWNEEEVVDVFENDYFFERSPDLLRNPDLYEPLVRWTQSADKLYAWPTRKVKNAATAKARQSAEKALSTFWRLFQDKYRSLLKKNQKRYQGEDGRDLRERSVVLSVLADAKPIKTPKWVPPPSSKTGPARPSARDVQPLTIESLFLGDESGPSEPSRGRDFVPKDEVGKEKTRGEVSAQETEPGVGAGGARAAQGEDEEEEGVQDAEDNPNALIRLPAPEYNLVRRFWKVPGQADTGGSVPWVDILRLMSAIGFEVSNRAGSSHTFRPQAPLPPDGSMAPVSIHKPHGRNENKMTDYMLRQIGRIWTLRYNWNLDTWGLRER
ncbi:hypothetical protein JX266_013817 [Neoarthrinium moseri]|nr:hypothetical protein JX266_013817 [Neoarthrinium moseri]